MPDYRLPAAKASRNILPSSRDPARSSGPAFQRPFTPNYPTAPDRARLPLTPLQPPASRPSYDLAGLGPFLGPYWHVPVQADFALLKKLRESIPVLDRAIVCLRQLIGVPEVECEDETREAEIRDWLMHLKVNRIQTGWSNWVATWCDDCIHYGRATAEMVLNNARNDVYGILELHPSTVALRPLPDGFSLSVVQYQSMGGVPVLMNPDLNLTIVNDIRSDDPNGTSLLYSLPFIGQIWNTMARSLGQTWGRFGSPTYHVNWEYPDDWNDPTGEETQSILGAMQVNFDTAMTNRAQGQVQDFFTAGKVTVEVVGANGEALEFSTPSQTIMEQIVAKTGLPPFLLGFSWSRSERLTTVQAITMTEIIEAYREQIEGQLYRLVEFRQAVVGRPTEFKLTWPKTTLQDRMEEARAEWMEAQGAQIQLENWQERVRLGINSMEDMAREFRPDLADFDDEEIRAELKELVDKPPDPLEMAAAAGPAGRPPRGPGGPTGEGTAALWASEMKAIVGNGSGH